MAQKIEFEAGDHILTSEGEYSDYCVGGFYKVLHPFNIREVLRMWPVLVKGVSLVFNEDGSINTYNSSFGEGSDGPIHYFESSFFAYLADHGFVEHIKHDELHLGDYGDITL